MHLLLALVILMVPGSPPTRPEGRPGASTPELASRAKAGRLPAPADQANADSLLNRLAGSWNGSGTVLNQPSKVSLSWSWELNGQFLRLSFRNEMPKQTFEGHAYYRPSASGPSTPLGASGYRGMWFDNSGMFRPLDARRDGDALVSKWGTPDTEEGETTYRLLSDTRMDIIDRVKSKDGQWREFGRSTVERQR